jgi:E3 ubiquitin-protein ligase UBR1
MQGDGGGEYSEGRRGKVCGHVFKAGESVYRCRDCSLDSTCVLCAKCFRGSSHTKRGHDVTMSIHAGVGAGCCDCGDVEAFKEGAHRDCKYHSLEMGGDEVKVTPREVEEVKATVEEVLRVLVDWMISILEGSPEEMVPPTSVEDIIAAVPLINRDHAAHSMPTFTASSTPHTSPPAPSSPSSSSPSSSNSFDPFSTSRALADTSDQVVDTVEVLGDASPDGAFRPTSPPTYVSSTSRGKARASSPLSTPAGPWSVVLWNDEKHSFAQVIDQVSRATGISRQRAADVAQRVDTHGRDVIYISPDPGEVVAVAKFISAIDLAVTVRSSRETFYEQVAGELVAFMKDLCAATVGGEGGVLSEVLANVLLERYGASGMSRFQKLVGVDARLWKEARKELAEVYVTLLGVSQAAKMELSESQVAISPSHPS